MKQFTHLDIESLGESWADYTELLDSNYSTYYTNAGRHYNTPSGKSYPSITTILGADPKKKASLDQWRQRVGHEEAERVSRVARDRGTSMHLICERYVDNEDTPFRDAMPDAVTMFKSLQPVLDEHLDNIHAQEATLFSDRLGVAGRVDVIGEWDGVPVILDFKTSNKPKRASWVHDYFMQCSAYAAMYYERTGFPIRDLVVAISVVDSEPQIFQEKVADWLPKLQGAIRQFHQING